MLGKCIAAATVLLCGLAQVASATEPPKIGRGPGRRPAIEFALRPVNAADASPYYRVLGADGGEIIGWSRLGVDLAGGEKLGGPCEVVSTTSRTVSDDFIQFPGKRRQVINECRETTVRLREKTAPFRHWEMQLRDYDDGVALRYRFPEQAGWAELAIAGERTEFALNRGEAYALPLNAFTTSHEQRYQTKSIDELPQQWLLGLPLLVHLQAPQDAWVAITEANINEYAGMYLSHTEGGLLATRLSPLPQEPGVAVRARLPHVSPWRVIMVADRPGALVESDLVLKLGEPCAIADTSWIKPGKTTFPWWNGFYEENVSFKPGLNTATMKYYIDFCAEAGIPYHSLDGTNDSAWYGGPIAYQGADPTKAVPEIDLPEVLRYAKEKGVRLRLWMHWKAARDHMQRSFPLYREWDIEGVMLDFMDRDDQPMNRFIRQAVALAAENHLTVTLHGCAQPTGLERTYPNLLTSEAVMNLEYDKWDKQGIEPQHEATVPFTRMLAGPLDFHQGSLRTVRPAEFKPRNQAPLVIGTPCRTLASYVVYQNHLSMVADYPSAYRGHPALAALVQIPSTWDETHVLDGSVGEYVAIARRSGDEWYVGAMAGGAARALQLPLSFLGEQRYTAEIWHDDPLARHGLSRRVATVTAGEKLDVEMAPAGGAYLRFTPEK